MRYIKVGVVDFKQQYILLKEDILFREMMKNHFGIKNIYEFIDFCECQMTETIEQIDSRYFNKINIKWSDDYDYSI